MINLPHTNFDRYTRMMNGFPYLESRGGKMSNHLWNNEIQVFAQVIENTHHFVKNNRDISRIALYLRENMYILVDILTAEKGLKSAEIVMETPILQGKNVEAAYEIVRKFAKKTPVLTCETMNQLSGRKLFFKCENFQKVGAFKFRGAIHAVSRLLSKDPEIKSVCTHSSGNHAQAVALAAKMRNIDAYIVMPDNALECKVNAVKGYGGKIIFSESTPTSREEKCTEVQKEKGSCFIHPSDEPLVILGAGTAFHEFYSQVDKNLSAVICPVGGGGLASGTGLAAKYLSNGKCKVYGAEPLNADDAFRSFKGGKHVKNPKGVKPKTIADGLCTNLGPNTFKVIKENFDDVFVVTEKQICDAMRLVWERMKIVIEPSSAVPVACVLFNEEFRKLKIEGNLGIILSGGNIDMSSFFSSIMEKCNSFMK